VSKLVALTVMNLVVYKATTKPELLINKLASNVNAKVATNFSMGNIFNIRVLCSTKIVEPKTSASQQIVSKLVAITDMNLVAWKARASAQQTGL
jgi:methanogenic corrinoid protein MtbC1